MRRALSRLWLVATLFWWTYSLFEARDRLSTFGERDWLLALNYGVNNLFCDLRILGLCREVAVPFFQRSQVNETFGLFTTFVGVPLLLFLLCLLIAWVFSTPAARL
jgi:hypothetical protein